MPMTIPGWGRVTPLQMGMLGLAGHDLDNQEPSEEERRIAIARGRSFLVRMTGQDFGYDLNRWHEYLLESHSAQYRHPYAWRAVRPAVERAIEDSERLRLVAILEQVPKKLSSEGFAVVIVESLIRAGFLQKNQLQPVVPFVREEIENRKALGEY
jgi:hypothetical protein